MMRREKRTGRRRLRTLGATLTVALLVLLALGAGSALADARWRLSARPAPTQLPREGQAFITLQANNPGDTEISALENHVTITDKLPEGVTATHIVQQQENRAEDEELAWTCSALPASEITCTYDPSKIPPIFRHLVAPYEDLELYIEVSVKEPAGAPTVQENTATVHGGRNAEQVGEQVKEGTELPPETLVSKFAITGAPTAYGLEEGGYKVSPEDENGLPDLRAGAHPFQLTTTLNLNEDFGVVSGLNRPTAPALTKNLRINLPPGLLGNVTAVPKCSDAEFGSLVAVRNECKDETAIGVARVTLEEPANFTLVTKTVPVFNLAPQAGEPARFGFLAYHVPVLLDTHVRTGGSGGGAGDYGVEVSVTQSTQLAQLLGSEVTLWGVPGDERHDRARGWPCVSGGFWVNYQEPCQAPKTRSTTAFLRMPTSCASPLRATLDAESWPFKAPGEAGLGNASSFSGESPFPAGFSDCASLPFEPSIKLKPTAHEADTPSGLEVDVHVPQATTLEGSGRSAADVRMTTVTLPEGVQLSPSAADGLEACSEGQIGYQGRGATDPYSPSESTPEPMRFSEGKAECPSASKVGTVKVKSPLLENELEGSVYLAAQDNNPFHSTVALYIVAEDKQSVVEEGKGTGVRVKLAGEVKLNPNTGQITSTFENTPQVPFEDFIVDFNSGPRASISTPPLCGDYTTGASFTSWAEGRVQTSSSDGGEFAVTSGAGGGPCSNPQPFAPAFSAGSTNLRAGAFSPFSLTITRHDSDQALKSVSVTLPPGAAAMLSSVTRCPEPQASQGTCGPESLIGHATAVTGFGTDPFTVTGGRVYITGPYHGAPFGLSIVTPAVAGPFNLGEVVVRSTINVDKSTAAVTVGSELPTFVQGVGRPNSGIPLQLKQINVVVDRPGFEFNPTNCNPMSITGHLNGIGGATAVVSAPFQVASCASLPFHPTLTAATQGNASKLNGASLMVKVTSTPGQANIAKTKLVLPTTLPSRLTTIQKACLDATFEANPAGCSEGSNIGTATVVTPVLKSPLSGPAYLVSHGNAAFPDVEFVLQGEGITLVLDGQTDIKKGITTSTFNTVPDAPVSTFETTLPEGPHSALTSNVAESKKFNLCGTKLVMPTTITGQNGAVITQETKIPVAGCKAVAAFKVTRAQKLAKALKACRKKFKRNAHKRHACEKQARKKYGAKKKAKKKAKKH